MINAHLDDQLRFHLLVDREPESESTVTQEQVRRVQVNFSIAEIFDIQNVIHETRSINSKDLFFSENTLSFMMELDELLVPERCQISLNSLIFTLKTRKKAEFELDYVMPFLELMNEPIKEEQLLHKTKSIPPLNFVEHVISSPESESKGPAIEFQPLEAKLGTFVPRDLPEEFHDKILKELDKVNDKKGVDSDTEFLIRECLLECLFLSLSCILNLRSLSDTEIHQLVKQLVKKYFREYLTGGEGTK